MTFWELDMDTRMEVTRRIQVIIGKKEEWVKEDMDRSQRINARFEYDKLFEKMAKIWMKYGDKALATQFKQEGRWAEGITASGKFWRLIPNSFGYTSRSRHCGTLVIDGETIFTSGTIAKAFEYILNS